MWPAPPSRLPLFAAVAVALSGCKRPPPAPAGAAVQASPAAPEPARGKHLALFYTADLRGEYDVCACVSHPAGGLPRRGTLVDRARAEADAVLQVDAGDLVLPRPVLLPGMKAPAPSELERRARLLLAGYARLGVDAIAPGEADLALGVRRFAALAREAEIPVLAANLVDAGGERPFRGELVVDAAGTKVGLFGIVEPAREDAERWGREGVQVLDPAPAIRAAIEALRRQGARIVVGLLHLDAGLPRARALATPGLDFVVLGHAGAKLDAPEEVKGTRILGAFELGRQLGRLDLHVVGEGGPFADRGARAHLGAIREDHRRQIAEHRRLGDDPEGRRVAKLEAAIVEGTRRLEALPPRIAGSWFDNQLLELDAGVPAQVGLSYLLMAYDAESARRAGKGLPVGVAPLPAAVPAARRPPSGKGPSKGAREAEPSETWEYGSNGACAMCHAEEAEQWKTTKHAEAMETLRRRKRHEDGACIGCHMTGYLLPGGTRSLKTATTYFGHVGCESCHGPSVAHVRAPDKKVGTRRQVPPEICFGCHTPDQTAGTFDYASALKEILGPGHGAP